MISLGLIVKNEVKQVKRIVKEAEPYFDGIYITCTHRPSLEKFKKLQSKKVHVDYFKWVEDFSAARNHNYTQIPEGWFFWVDADDIVDFSKIPALVKEATSQQADSVFLKYDYAQDEYGQTIVEHWRERLVNMKHGWEWKGAVHETLISPRHPKIIQSDLLVVHHDNVITEENVHIPREKALRNHKILLREVEQGDPRTFHYLGLSYFNLGEYQNAIKVLRKHIQTSGSESDMYNSAIRIGLCYMELGDLKLAISETLGAVEITPSRPEAYLYLAQYYFQNKDYKKCLEHLKTANTKPAPETFDIVEPSMLSYRPVFLASMAHFYLGKFDVAYALLINVLEENPYYQPAKSMYRVMTEEAVKKAKVDAIKKVSQLFDTDDKFQVGLYSILPKEFKEDVRLNPLRARAIPPRVWPKGSVVFYCGRTNEDWGPDYLYKGMGGSEEAIVYLARELARAGKEVVVYNTRSETYVDEGDFGKVVYEPYYQFDAKAQYSNIVIWRMPEFAKVVNAQKIFVDLHDTVEDARVRDVADIVDLFFVKSEYHKNLYTIPDNKFKVVTNGIVLDHFDLKEPKERKYDIGYFSSPDRGLLALLKMWDKIQEKRPGTTGIWNYGWQSYTSVHGQDALYKEIKALFEKHKDTFIEGGRITHTMLAKNMKNTKVWAYPTEFTEINCITALKAQQAGAWPVVTNVAALQETVQSGTKLPYDDIYTNKKAQDEFIDTVIEHIDKGSRPKPMKDVGWEGVAKQWLESLV